MQLLLTLKFDSHVLNCCIFQHYNTSSPNICLLQKYFSDESFQNNDNLIDAFCRKNIILNFNLHHKAIIVFLRDNNYKLQNLSFDKVYPSIYTLYFVFITLINIVIVVVNAVPNGPVAVVSIAVTISKQLHQSLLELY